MTDTDRITELEATIHALQAQQDDLQEQLTRAQLEHWQGRIDDLEVQLRLATMETGDRISPLVQTMRDRLLDARQAADSAATNTREAVSTVVSGLEQAIRDIRQSVLDATSNMRS